MASLKGTQTAKNLMAAFAGESQARNRYTFFAAKARKEGYVQIADIFAETADQEKEHAKRFFNFMEGGAMDVEGGYPFGVIGTTLENLREAAGGEHHEAFELYPKFAADARAEGFEEIAKCFDAVIVSEQQHERRYKALAENIEKDRVFKRDTEVTWRCRNCGWLVRAKEAPDKCPACIHPRAHFEILAENW